MKKFLSLTLALLLIFSMAACGSKPSSTKTSGSTGAEVSYADHIIYADSSQITLLDPEGNGNDNEGHSRVFGMVYDQLCRYNAQTGELEPKIATEWTYNDTYDSINIKIRDDVNFHNGTHMTADDVIFSLDRSAGAFRSYIDSFEKVSDTEFNIKLGRPNSELMYYLAQTNASIVSKAAVEADPNNGPQIGTGPWVIDFEKCLAGTTVELVRNDNYWGELPKTKQFTFQYVANPSSRLVAVQNNEAQITYQISVNELDIAKADPNLNVIDYDASSLTYVAFNTSVAPFNDENFRKAVAFAINRDDLKAACGLPDNKSSKTLFSFRAKGYNPDPEVYTEYDPEKAKEYLAKVPGDHSFELMVNTSSETYRTLGEVIQEELRQVGISCTIREVDGAGLSANSKYKTANHQALIYGISLKDYPSDIGRLLSPDLNSNKSIVYDEEINQIIADATATTDDAKINELYGRLQNLVNEKCYYVPLYYNSGTIVTVKGVDGLGIDGTNRHNYSYAYEEISK